MQSEHGNILRMNIYTLVMAGGGGTRLWPESTTKLPKQYLKLLGDDSLLQQTLLRLGPLIDVNRRFLVTVKDQEHLAEKESGTQLLKENIILEPFGKNTAPCILLALAALSNRGASPEDVVFITPADHVVGKTDNFQKTVAMASTMAVKQKKILVIGIPPTHPHTGYGYIEQGDPLDDGFLVKSFKEKPDTKTASSYVNSGKFFWNAGLFVATMETFLLQFKTHAPFLFKYFAQLKDNWQNFSKIKDIYQKMREISIDYAIMEKSDQIMAVAANFTWNDLGSWDALEEVIPSTVGNTLIRSSGHFIKDAKGNIVHAPGKFISIIGVDDLVVVANKKAVMVLKKTETQRVKEIISYLKDSDQSLL